MAKVLGRQTKPKRAPAPDPKFAPTPAPEPERVPELKPSLLDRYRAACALFPDLRVEVVNGRIVVNEVPTWDHNKIVSRLLKQIITITVEEGWELATNTLLFLGPQADRYIPDLTVAPPHPRMWGEDAVYAEDTILVVEVVSPSSVNDDHLIKPLAYGRAGVPAFLCIDPLERRAHLYTIPGEDGYEGHNIVSLGTELKLPDPWGIVLDTGALLDAPAAPSPEPATTAAVAEEPEPTDSAPSAGDQAPAGEEPVPVS
ncbi:Uma2 family endonuclease [Nonomuraea longicatena]|uniref:Putative restriction endonuclease domain-containing protein n=1 Tax=Nonomuraea longicatena TaxID=83682 RepID=A0ABN1P2S7_9ACTN